MCTLRYNLKLNDKLVCIGVRLVIYLGNDKTYMYDYVVLNNIITHK